MIKVLFDTNIILDVALDRQPFVADSLKAINTIGEQTIGFVNVLTLVNTFYIARKEKGTDKAKEFVGEILEYFEIVNISKQMCIEALRSEFKDFEDAVQAHSAYYSGIEIIVTRNPKDFKTSTLKIFEPSEFISWIELQQNIEYNQNE